MSIISEKTPQKIESSSYESIEEEKHSSTMTVQVASMRIESSTDSLTHLHDKRESSTDIEDLEEACSPKRSKRKISEKQSVSEVFKEWVAPISEKLPLNIRPHLSNVASQITLYLDLLEKPSYYSLREISLAHIQFDKLTRLFNEHDLEKLTDDILTLEEEVKNSPLLSPIVRKIKDILYASYANTCAIKSSHDIIEDLEKTISALKRIRNIDLRMSIIQFYRLEIYADIHDDLCINQDLIINKLRDYLSIRNPHLNTQKLAEGLCHGFSILYGYYEFLNRKDDFFARLERVLDDEIISLHSMDSTILEKKTHLELTEKERECEDLCNDILYLQAEYERGFQKDFCSSIQDVSERREILSLRSRLQHTSFFEYDAEKNNYNILVQTIKSIVNIDKQTKYLHISTGSHSLGIFYRSKRCFLYDPNDDLPSLLYKSEGEDTINDLVIQLTTLLELHKKPISLSIDLITNEPIKELAKLKRSLSKLTNTGTPERPSYNEITPLHISCAAGSLECVDELLEKKAAPDVRNDYYETPLHIASFRGDVEIIRSLLKAGADINAIDYEKNTPLHNTCQDGQLEAAILLLGAGARTDIQNMTGLTALEWAEEKGYVEIVEALKEYSL